MPAAHASKVENVNAVEARSGLGAKGEKSEGVLMRTKGVVCALLIMTPGLLFAGDETKADARKLVRESAGVFNEIMSAPDKSVPQEVLEKAQCIGIVPNLKRAGFVFGAKYGRGVLVCRDSQGWSAPSIIRIEGGSIGFQIGAGETDLLFVLQNKSGEEKLMQDKFTIGADVSAMGGPVGRSGEAETDAQMRAEILSYSRARGVFAGISLEGATLRPDNTENHELYGAAATQRKILTGGVPHPADAGSLYSALRRYTREAHVARK